MGITRQRIGHIGWPSYRNDAYAVTTAVCDINEAKIKAYVASRSDVQGYTDYREMAEKAPLDAVIISTPNWLHREMAECFLAQGVHVFLEKPMGVNREEIDAVLTAQEASGKQCVIDFELRISYMTRRLRELIAAGEIGELRGFEFIHHRGAWLAEGNGVWRTQPERSGGLYFMEVCHEVDLLRYVMGEITHVQSFSAPNVLPQYPDNMPDNVVTHFWFESGARGTIMTGHTSSVHPAATEHYGELGHDMYFVFVGTQGAIRLDCLRAKFLISTYEEFHPDADVGKVVSLNRIEDYGTMNANRFHHDISGNVNLFIKNCALGQPPVQDTRDAWRTHVVCLACEASAVGDSGRIEIDYACR